MPANTSFYQYILLIAGVSAGLAELHFIRNGDISDARVLSLALISLAFPLGLIYYRGRLHSRHEKMAALARRKTHIWADYFCIIGATTMFSMLAYVTLSEASYFERGWNLSRFALTMLLNASFFCVGMMMLSSIAREERADAKTRRS